MAKFSYTSFQNFYVERFGTENVVIIKDSNAVDMSSLDSEKAYIQITYVEPYFEAYELRHRVTYFDRNFNMSKYNMMWQITIKYYSSNRKHVISFQNLFMEFSIVVNQLVNFCT
jgi:hypothetical protein